MKQSLTINQIVGIVLIVISALDLIGVHGFGLILSLLALIIGIYLLVTK